MVAPIINNGSSQGRGRGHGGSYSSKGRGGQNHGVDEQNNIDSNHNPSSNNSWHGGRGDIYNKSNVLSVIIFINATIMQMSADSKVIIILPIVLKKTVITYKIKMIIHYDII